MRRFQDIPIKRKLILISMFTSTTALLLASLAFLAYEQITFRREMVHELSILAEIIGDNSTVPLSSNDQESAEQTLAALSTQSHIVSACIYTVAGGLFANYLHGESKEDCPLKPEENGHSFEKNSLGLFQQIVLDGERIGTIYLQSDLQEVYDRLIRYVVIGAALLASSLAALLLSSKLQQVISGPITHLAETAGLVSTEKNYAIRAVKRSRDELGLLTDRFNEMLAQIQERDAALQNARNELEERVEGRTKTLQQEITERRRTEAALRESEERYAVAIRGANDGLWDWNLKKNTIYFSPRWKLMLGYEDDEIGSSRDEWFKRIHPEDREQVQTAVTGHLEGLIPQFEQEHRMQHKDGNYRWMVSRGLAVRDADGKPTRMAGSQRDITARRDAEEQLLHDAFYDKLTRLSNRALFMDRLGRVISRAKRRKDYLFAVLFLDLDRFKIVNDSLGHMIGDELLIAIARRLEAVLRPQDTVARLGGDEFTILVDDLKNVSGASRLANRIQEELKLPFNLSGHEVVTTCSIGIALSTTGYDRPEDILRDADTAMYRAKALGPSQQQVFDAGMHAHALALLEMEADLRRAAERKELHLFYQPIISLLSGRIVGFEALLRWRHPRWGFIPPAAFIPIAEETGLIIPIGRWVLQQACCQIAAWQAQFPVSPPLRMSVNLSARQLPHPNLIEEVDQIFRETGPEAESVGLEITESVIMDNAETATGRLNQLRDRGIRLYMDDFGTGYSSLSSLHRFPIDVLKIDRSFVNRLGKLDRQAEIVQAIVTLAHSHDMSVVAEGVETKDQLAVLRALRCEYGQGYLFSKPIDSEAAAMLMRRKPEW
ncbi:MAG: EAL domain-containing protein [Nitrospiria bacterium]